MSLYAAEKKDNKIQIHVGTKQKFMNKISK